MIPWISPDVGLILIFSSRGESSERLPVVVQFHFPLRLATQPPNNHIFNALAKPEGALAPMTCSPVSAQS
jgi:hypothetical protein